MALWQVGLPPRQGSLRLNCLPRTVALCLAMPAQSLSSQALWAFQELRVRRLLLRPLALGRGTKHPSGHFGRTAGSVFHAVCR